MSRRRSLTFGTVPQGTVRRSWWGLSARYLVPLSALSVYALIVLGGTVRATGSSLACPDWPLCHGQLVPPLERQILIEYSHRLLASVTGLLVALSTLVVWLRHRDNGPLLLGVTLAIPLIVAQALLGGATVEQELPPALRAAHLGMALAVLASLLFATVAVLGGLAPAGPGARANARPGPLLAVTLVAALAVLSLNLLGSFVSNLGAALVYPDWPLFNGGVLPGPGRLAHLHYAHRVLAAFIGLLVLWWAARAWWTGRRPLQALAAVTVTFYIAQTLVGASNIWLQLPTAARVAHVALASAIWAALVTAASWLYLQRRASQGD